MSEPAELESLFSNLGANFLLSGEEIHARLKKVRAFVFDWDGVFNRGEKGPGSMSLFSEPDSMGTNLLRYAFWRTHGVLPICAIISGANNETAEFFARREHFHSAYCGVLNKSAAFESLEEAWGISRNEAVYVFDDVNDFSVADDCLLRCLIRRDASQLMHEYAVTNGLCDYVTAAPAGQYPVREIAELLIGMLGGYPAVFESRQRFDEQYQEYWSERQKISTGIFNAD